MRILIPGKAESGFTTLDAVIAVFITVLVWGAVFPLVLNLSRSMEAVGEKSAALYTEIAEREARSWFYAAEVPGRE